MKFPDTPLAQAMELLADDDVAVPFALVCEAWDVFAGSRAVERKAWEFALMTRIERFRDLQAATFAESAHPSGDGA